MKLLPLLLCLTAQPILALEVTVLDSAGKPIPAAQAALVFKSGAFQKGVQEGEILKFDSFKGTARLLVAAPAHEARSESISDKEKHPVVLKPSDSRSSLLLYGKTEIPGKGGDLKISVKADANYINSFGIGINDGSRPAKQPYQFRLKSALSAVDSTGKPFKVYALETSENVSLIEYTP